jgi:ankyrin repeat protein
MRFLLAALHEKCLASSYDIEQFKRDLASLSNSPDEVYEVALDRIKKQDKRSQDLAMKVLVWLAFADRDLKTNELAHAISISNSTDKIRALQANLPTCSRMSTIEALISPCAGLVLIDKKSNTIRLAHRTAEDYLRVQDSIYRLACADIAQTCLLCLSHVPFEPSNNAKLSLEIIHDYESKYPLIRYAANHWGHHLRRGVHSSVKQLGWTFFSDSPRVNLATQFMVECENNSERNISGLHLAAYYGLTDFVKSAIGKKRPIAIDAITTWDRTALHWAVKYRQHDFLVLLVQEGADPNIADTEKRTALLSAIHAGDHRSVEILLSSKKSIDFQLADRERYTPLRMAAANGQSKLAEMLLDKGAEIDASDELGWTALRCAADKGDISMIKTLLDRKASPNPPIKKIENHWTLLSWAAREGYEQIIKRLADMGVDLDEQDSEGCTALHLAARYSHAMTAWWLIEAGATIAKPDRKGYTPFHEAMRKNTARNNASIVYLLSEKGADLEAKTKFGSTPLHLAASEGNDSTVWFLIQKQVKDSKKDSKGHTALHSATGAGHAKVVHTLLWKYPNLVNQKDFSNRTPLHEAATYRQAHIAQILLHGGASIDSQDIDGLTPLHIAVKQDSFELVECLLAAKADPNIVSKKKETASGLAAKMGNKSIIEAIRRAEEGGIIRTSA